MQVKKRLHNVQFLSLETTVLTSQNPNVAICRAGGLDNEELKSVLQEESCMSRTLIGLERLEMQRDRLRAVAALSGMG
jgi:hypothetical protein